MIRPKLRGNASSKCSENFAELAPATKKAAQAPSIASARSKPHRPPVRIAGQSRLPWPLSEPAARQGSTIRAAFSCRTRRRAGRLSSPSGSPRSGVPAERGIVPSVRHLVTVLCAGPLSWRHPSLGRGVGRSSDVLLLPARVHACGPRSRWSLRSPRRDLVRAPPFV